MGFWIFLQRTSINKPNGLWVLGFYFFNLDFRWLLGVDLVGFELNCWINARICGLIVAGLCLYLVVVDGG